MPGGVLGVTVMAPVVVFKVTPVGKTPGVMVALPPAPKVAGTPLTLSLAATLAIAVVVTPAGAVPLSVVGTMLGANTTLSAPVLLVVTVSLTAPVVAVTLTVLLGWVKLIAATMVVLGATLAGTFAIGNVTIPLIGS